MPNLAMATDTICGQFNSAWADRAPVEWPNVPVPDPHFRDGSDPWCAFDLAFEGGENATIGSRVFSRSGHLVVRIFVPAGERGLERANELAMVALDAFEGKTIDGVSFYNVGMKTVGPDGPWFQVNVRADFEFDEVKQ
jgi:hypothetical protein